MILTLYAKIQLPIAPINFLSDSLWWLCFCLLCSMSHFEFYLCLCSNIILNLIVKCVIFTRLDDTEWWIWHKSRRCEIRLISPDKLWSVSRSESREIIVYCGRDSIMRSRILSIVFVSFFFSTWLFWINQVFCWLWFLSICRCSIWFQHHREAFMCWMTFSGWITHEDRRTHSTKLWQDLWSNFRSWNNKFALLSLLFYFRQSEMEKWDIFLPFGFYLHCWSCLVFAVCLSVSPEFEVFWLWLVEWDVRVRQFFGTSWNAFGIQGFKALFVTSGFLCELQSSLPWQ